MKKLLRNSPSLRVLLRLFITHADCSVRTISKIKAEVEKLCRFDEVMVTKASATVSSNCGPETVGVLFVRRPD